MYTLAIIVLLILVARQWMADVPEAHDLDPRISEDLSNTWDSIGRLIIYGLITLAVLLFLGVI